MKPARKIRMVKHAELVAMDEQRALIAAELTAVRAVLAAVMRTLDRTAGDPQESKVWAQARALLAEER